MDLLNSLGLGKKRTTSPIKSVESLTLLVNDALPMIKGSTPVESSITTSTTTGGASAGGATKLSETIHQIGLRLEEIKNLFLGGSDSDQDSKEEDCRTVAHILIQKNTFYTIITNLALFEALSFEAQKDVAILFCSLATSDLDGFLSKHLVEKKKIVIKSLVNGYEEAELALLFGMMLRACLANEALQAEFLDKDFVLLDQFFKNYLVVVDAFDIVSDAFVTFSKILLSHKVRVVEFLEKHFDAFFERFDVLLLSENYVTQRQSLKLLSDILLDPSLIFQHIMIRYVNKKENLKTIMTIMRKDSSAIQVEAFHVFKLFVANPEKTDGTISILFKNREKIINYLTNIDLGESGNKVEIQTLIETLSQLNPPATPGTSATPPMHPAVTPPAVTTEETKHKN